jgi:hypothetical protein
MVRSLYPQRWLPYHYLGPFAFDRWDALSRLRNLPTPPLPPLPLSSPAAFRPASTIGAPPSLWIRSGKDEIIPTGGNDGVRTMFADWVRVAEEDSTKWVDIVGALHDTAYTERRWREEVRRFLEAVGRGKEAKVGAEKEKLLQRV